MKIINKAVRMARDLKFRYRLWQFDYFGGPKLFALPYVFGIIAILLSEKAILDYKYQVMDYLSVPLIPEPEISQNKASRLIGVYRDRKTGNEFTVQYESGYLTIDIFLNVRTRLVPGMNDVFLTEGWHFEMGFEEDSSGKSTVMKIGGKDVDYLKLVGTIAERVSA